MSNYSVKKPITVLMGILIVITLGIFAVTRLPLNLFPDINLPYLVTITTYEGENPETLEREVSSQIEAAAATVNSYAEIQSMSYEHFAVSMITFEDGANMDSAFIELRESMNNIAFPDGVGNTRILRISPDMLPVMQVSLYQTYADDVTDEEALILNTAWINEDIMTDLTSISGVADVSVSGASDTILQINLDETILATYDVSIDDVLQTIEDQNVAGLVGVALDQGEIRMLYLGDNPSSLTEVQNLPILEDGGEVIHLNDLVNEDGITYINADTESYSKINGTQGINISFQAQSDYSITEVTDNILSRLDDILDDYPDAGYDILLNQGEYIRLSINSVLQNLIFGAILAIIVLFIFLRDIKPTLIVGLAIPISVIAAFMLMYFTGVTLNMVSMGGLALGIGMLVDNAIVVIENIYRLIGEGKSKKEAAIYGAKQVAGAITASTLTTVAVFLPILFLEGIINEIFINMMLTIAYSLGASLIIGLTMVPMLSSKMLDDKKPMKESKFMHSIKYAYEKAVNFTIHHQAITYIAVLGLLVGSFFLVYSKGFIMLPTSDEGYIDITVTTESSATFAGQADYTDYVTDQIMALEDIETVSATIGSGGSSGLVSMRNMISGGGSGISITVSLLDERAHDTEYYRQEIIDLFEAVDFDEVNGLTASEILEVDVASQDTTASITGAAGISIKVSGYDLETLESIANDITNVLDGVAHVEDVDNGVDRGADNVKLTVDVDNAMMVGLTVNDVNENIAYFFTTLEGLVSVTDTVTLNIEGVPYDIEVPQTSISGGISFDVFGGYEQFLSNVLLFDDDTRVLMDAYMDNGGILYVPNASIPGYTPGTPIAFVLNPYLYVENDAITMMPSDPFTVPTLASLAVAPLYDNTDDSVTNIELMTGFSTIYTDGSNRFLTVTGQIEDGYNVTLISSDVVDAVNDYLDSEDFSAYGGGYNVSFQGENEDILTAVNDLVIAGLIAIALVYMVMAIQFQSLLYPLIILGTVPLAFTGGMLALLVTNMNLSMVSIMGLIVLVGVVVNNGIVLIDYINKLREQGRGVKEAIVEAGKTRIRPIFMTALTTILALFIMALGIGQGSELLQPMAVTAIGGLIYATVLTLLVVPSIYALVNRKKIKVEEAKEAEANVNEG